MIGRKHGVARLVPADRGLRGLGQRRVAVPVVERLHAEPLRLHRIVAVRQPRIGLAHGLGQRVDDAALDAVGEVSGIGDVLEAAPAVGDLLVLGQRVGDEREDPQILLEGASERFGRRAALFRVGVLQAVQRRLQHQLLAVDFEAQLRHRLVEQAVPGAAPGDRLFVEQLLDAILELVGLVHPEVEHPGTVVAERRIGVEGGADQRVVDQIELQGKEQQMRAGVGHLFLDVAVELGALRIGRVAGVDECRIGNDAADQFLERFIFAKALSKAGLCALGGLGRELALPAVFESHGVGCGLFEIAREFRARPSPDRGRQGSIPAGCRAWRRLRPLRPWPSVRWYRASRSPRIRWEGARRQRIVHRLS